MKTIIALLALIALSVLAGCGTLGNGKIDVPVDVEVIYEHKGVEYHAKLGQDEVALKATDNLGNVYEVGYAPDSGATVYISPADNAFVASDGGRLVLTLPGGGTVKVERLED